MLDTEPVHQQVHVLTGMGVGGLDFVWFNNIFLLFIIYNKILNK